MSLVAAGNDYQKDLQFRKLNAQKDIVEIKARRGGGGGRRLLVSSFLLFSAADPPRPPALSSQVIRDGKEMLVTNTSLVVGDTVLLITGDKPAADGVLVAAQGLVVDEASLTGESDPVKKSPAGNPWIRCGTQVQEGSGTMVVTAVGVHSEWGRTMAMVVGDAGTTPLQEALTVLAQAVGKVGLGVGVLCFLVLMVRWMVENKGFPLAQFSSGPLRFFIFAITIIVVAVPEGLPLAVTISLAYSMRKMMKVWGGGEGRGERGSARARARAPTPRAHTHTRPSCPIFARTSASCACWPRARRWAARPPSARTRPGR